MDKKIETAKEAVLDRIIELMPKTKAKDMYSLVTALKSIQEKPFDPCAYLKNTLVDLNNLKKKDKK